MKPNTRYFIRGLLTYHGLLLLLLMGQKRWPGWSPTKIITFLLFPWRHLNMDLNTHRQLIFNLEQQLANITEKNKTLQANLAEQKRITQRLQMSENVLTWERTQAIDELNKQQALFVVEMKKVGLPKRHFEKLHGIMLQALSNQTGVDPSQLTVNYIFRRNIPQETRDFVEYIQRFAENPCLFYESTKPFIADTLNSILALHAANHAYHGDNKDEVQVKFVERVNLLADSSTSQKFLFRSNAKNTIEHIKLLATKPRQIIIFPLGHSHILSKKKQFHHSSYAVLQTDEKMTRSIFYLNTSNRMTDASEPWNELNKALEVNVALPCDLAVQTKNSCVSNSFGYGYLLWNVFYSHWIQYGTGLTQNQLPHLCVLMKDLSHNLGVENKIKRALHQWYSQLAAHNPEEELTIERVLQNAALPIFHIFMPLRKLAIAMEHELYIREFLAEEEEEKKSA